MLSGPENNGPVSEETKLKILLIASEFLHLSSGGIFAITLVVGIQTLFGDAELLRWIQYEMRSSPNPMLYLVSSLQEQGYSDTVIGIVIIGFSRMPLALHLKVREYIKEKIKNSR